MKPLTFTDISCPAGNCHASVSLWAQKSVDITDLDIQDSEHPNLAKFTGTLLLLDQPSNQPPHGSDGHPIYVPTRVAEKRLDTLPGMGINYQDDLEGHNPTQKIGVISKAWIDGKRVRVEGVIWKKDFPEALKKFRMNRGRLGMSMELGDVYVREKDEDVWHLEDFHFTGATILRKDHAAYENTDLAASRQCFVSALAAAREAVKVIQGKGGKPEMADDNKKKKHTSAQTLVTVISAAVGKSIGESLKAFQDQQKKTNELFAGALKSISTSQEELVKGIHAMAAGTVEAEVDAESIDAEADVEEIDASASNASDATMSSARKSNASNPSDATDPSDASDGTDPSDLDAGVDPTNYTSGAQDGAEPGNLNPDTSADYREQARGPASSRIQKTGKTGTDRGIAAAREKTRERGTLVARSMAAARVIRTLTAQNKTLKETIKRSNNRLASLEASVERYAERVERRTITPEISSLLEKAGHDVREMMASKQKLSVAEVDDMFLKSGVQLDPTMRAAFKNQLTQAGLMEMGEVRRWAN